MRNFSKKISTLALLGFVALSFSTAAFAADGENSLTGFFRRIFKFPVKATEETGKMTTNTLQNTGENLSTAGEHTAAVVTGDVPQAGELVQDVVTQTAETAGQTVAETAQIPVVAVEEAAK